MEQKIIHIGFYGILTLDNHILVVRKSRGPYKGKLDLPGGRQEKNETPSEALVREVKEETGVQVVEHTHLFDLEKQLEYINPKGKAVDFHHFASVFHIPNFNLSLHKSDIKEEDASGNLWVDKDTLNASNSSPILIEALQNFDQK